MPKSSTRYFVEELLAGTPPSESSPGIFPGEPWGAPLGRCGSAAGEPPRAPEAPRESVRGLARKAFRRVFSLL
eukprot:1061743-Pyramimonas_sp.AAC.1